MNRVTPQMRNFARRLIAYESRGSNSSGPKTWKGFTELEKLGRHLITFTGHTGFHSLLSRSLTQSAADAPWLRGVQVKMDGALAGLEELQAQLHPDEISGGREVLLARLLGLLIALIGASLTLRLVGEVWPKVPLDDFDFSDRPRK